MNKNITLNVRALHYECAAGRMPLRDVQPWTSLALALLLLAKAVSHYEASLALTFYLIELLTLLLVFFSPPLHSGMLTRGVLRSPILPHSQTLIH